MLDPHASSPEAAIRRWLEEVVIGLGLCPFAASPWRRARVRLVVSEAADEVDLLVQLQQELLRLDAADPAQLETTLVIVPRMFRAFDDFNQFLDPAEALLAQFGWTGRFQIASFHPDYRFAGTRADDAGNLTNRSPYPVLHLLREASIDRVLASHPDPEGIPARNIDRLRTLDATEIARLFPYTKPT